MIRLKIGAIIFRFFFHFETEITKNRMKLIFQLVNANITRTYEYNIMCTYITASLQHVPISAETIQIVSRKQVSLKMIRLALYLQRSIVGRINN